MEQIKMTKDDAVKLVTSEDIKKMLEAEGWVVEAEAPRRGRPAKSED